MHQVLNSINYLVGEKDKLKYVDQIPTKKIFDDRVIAFLAALSKALFRDAESKKYADISAFAFWIRKASLDRIKQSYEESQLRVGRGVVFQITPSNIPVQFAVSMVYALLSGNVSVTRVSEKQFPQVDIICRKLNELLQKEYSDIRDYVVVIRYGHSDEITSYLSRICDARMIWGGDATINQIRQFPLAPRAIELCFANRYSAMVIDSNAYLQMDANVIARDFYTDTYWVDQNACSSPSIIIWLGSQIGKAQDIFWNSISELAHDEYKLESIMSCEKLMKFTKMAMEIPQVHMKRVCSDNTVRRVSVDRLSSNITDYKGSCGFFIEYCADNLQEIVPILGKRCQTIVSCGVNLDAIQELVYEKGVRGIDRIVSIGHALDLSIYWDGYDIIRELSRVVYME